MSADRIHVLLALVCGFVALLVDLNLAALWYRRHAPLGDEDWPTLVFCCVAGGTTLALALYLISFAWIFVFTGLALGG